MIFGLTAVHLGQPLAPLTAEQKEWVVPAGENGRRKTGLAPGAGWEGALACSMCRLKRSVQACHSEAPRDASLVCQFASSTEPTYSSRFHSQYQNVATLNYWETLPAVLL